MNMEANLEFLKELERLQSDPGFVAERLVIEINEEVCRLMSDRKLSRAALAQRMNVSRQLITRLLNGKTNMTLLTLCKLAVALGASVYVKLGPKPSSDLIVGLESSGVNETADSSARVAARPAPESCGI